MFAKKILWNRFAAWSILFLLIQQIIVASSTFWISALSEAVVSGQTFGLYLALFISSLFIVYLPGIVAGFNLEKAKSQAIYRYTAAFSDKYHCLPEMMADKTEQGDKEPWLTNESSRTIEEVYGIAYDSLSTGLNTVLNIIALCIAIDSRLIFGYLASFIILPLTSHYFKNKLAKAALTLQNDRKSMAQILLSGWDNIIIGNIYNFTIWWKQFTKRWNDYNHSSAHTVLLNQISSTCATVLSLIPIAGVFLWIFLTTNDIAKLAALVATLPRQIQIIQHFEVLATYAMYWHGAIAKTKALLATIVTPQIQKSDLLARIKQDDITFFVNEYPINFETVEQFLVKITEMTTGRVTIRGKNGSGKTTLINLIKKELGDKAYYLPTNAKLAFEKTLEGSYSTGQKIVAYLEEISLLLFHAERKSSIGPVLLFDEWDANLDLNNKQIISSMLDEFSKQYCVVEISHRYEEN